MFWQVGLWKKGGSFKFSPGRGRRGKTILAQQVLEAYPHPWVYGSADDPVIKDRDWVFQQWDLAKAGRRWRCFLNRIRGSGFEGRFRAA